MAQWLVRLSCDLVMVIYTADHRGPAFRLSLTPDLSRVSDREGATNPVQRFPGLCRHYTAMKPLKRLEPYYHVPTPLKRRVNEK